MGHTCRIRKFKISIGLVTVSILISLFINIVYHKSKSEYFSNCPSNICVIIKVLSYNRIESLKRTLNSLLEADYESDKVPIELYIDHLPFTESE